MSIECNTEGDCPRVDPTAFVHPSAVLTGKVQIAGGVFIGPQAVLRADERGPEGRVEPIVVREDANIQDGVIIHALGGTGVTIGSGTSVAHGAVVHGPCEIGANCFIGFNSVVYGATLGQGVVVMHQAIVEGVAVPDALYVTSMTAVRCDDDVRCLAGVPPAVAAFVDSVRVTNSQFSESYAVL